MFIRTTLAAALAATALGGTALAAQETAARAGGSECVARLEEKVQSDRRFEQMTQDRQMTGIVEGTRSFAAKLDEHNLDYTEGCGALLNAMNVAVDEYIEQKGSGQQAMTGPSGEEIESRAENLADTTLVVDFASMIGVNVMNYGGEHLGQARAVIIHGNDSPSHLLVQRGNAWERHGAKGAVAIPFDRVKWDRESAAFYVDLSEQAFEKAPEFARADDWSAEQNNQWYQKNVQ